MSRSRLLVIDADMPKRLATQLQSRDRKAVSASELGVRDLTDPLLLKELAGRFSPGDWVLVTGDDQMPAEHGKELVALQVTVATIHPDYPDETTQHNWRYDVTHRWAHAMQDQDPATVRRYSLHNSQVWRPRRRHLREIARHGWTPWRSEDALAERGRRMIPAGPEPSPMSQDRLPGVE